MYRIRDGDELILASGSPRRQQLLRGVGISFRTVVPDVDESLLPGEQPADLVRRLARAKADAVAAARSRAWVLAADTVVALDGVIYGKPADKDEAVRMLTSLQYREHTVWGGFALVHGASAHCHEEVHQTAVVMTALAGPEIERYVATGEPLDKAGAYAAQGLGGAFIESIRGSYSNVVGLHLPAVIGALRRLGIIEIGA